MMINDTTIANAALRAISAQAITSLDDGSDRAFDVSQYFIPSLEAFLSEFNWSFATREASLGMIDSAAQQFGSKTSQEVLSNEYLYGYTLPSDFLRLTGFTQPCRKIKYNIRLYRNQLAIFCNVKAVSIVYISRNISYDSMSAHAREALTFRLAMFLDSARNAGANVQRLNELYQGMLRSAINMEPSTHDRKYLDEGNINRARREDSYEFAKYGLKD